MKESYTVKEIADILGYTKTTITKTIKALCIEPDKMERNKFYYGAEKARQIITDLRPDFDFSIFENSQTETANSQTENSGIFENSQTEKGEKTENSTTKTANSQTETANSTEQQIIDELRRTITIFEKELNEKNEQLKVKDSQIETLNNTIQMLNDTIQGQLLLNAREKKLIEAETAEAENKTEEKEQKKEKISFFRRIFKKNNWNIIKSIL